MNYLAGKFRNGIHRIKQIKQKYCNRIFEVTILRMCTISYMYYFFSLNNIERAKQSHTDAGR